MRELTTRLVLGGHKMRISLHQLARILKDYIEVLTGFSHIHSPDSISTTLLFQGCILGTASRSRNNKQNAHFKDQGRGREVSITWLQLLGQTGGHIFLMTSSNNTSSYKDFFSMYHFRNSILLGVALRFMILLI